MIIYAPILREGGGWGYRGGLWTRTGSASSALSRVEHFVDAELRGDPIPILAPRPPNPAMDWGEALEGPRRSPRLGGNDPLVSRQVQSERGEGWTVTLRKRGVLPGEYGDHC